MPEPLHPAIVHLPIAIAAVTPLAALSILWAVRSQWLPARAWLIVVALQLIVALGGWVAAETGEREEESVERIVAERFIEAHEEAAERFLAVAVVALVPMVGGLLVGRRGERSRMAGAVGAVLTLAAVVPAGHLGGELVYVHGAAAAYTRADLSRPTSEAVPTRHPASPRPAADRDGRALTIHED